MTKHKIKMSSYEWAVFWLLVKEAMDLEAHGIELELTVVAEFLGKHKVGTDFSKKKNLIIKDSEKIAMLRSFKLIPIDNDEWNIARNNLITKLDQIGGYK